MTLLYFLLLVGADVASPDPNDDIIVIGQRLKRWTGKYKIRGASISCKTATTTGDKEIDAIGCQAFTACAVSLANRIAASDEKSLGQEERLAMKNTIKQDLATCVADRRSELVSALAKRRADQQTDPR